MKKVTGLVLALLLPTSAFAITTITDVNTLKDTLVGLGNIVVYLLVSLAVIFIVWNVVMALIHGNDPAKKTEALKSIGYGILGLAIVVSLWGIVNILTGTFKTSATLKDQTIPNLTNNATKGGIPVDGTVQVN